MSSRSLPLQTTLARFIKLKTFAAILVLGCAAEAFARAGGGQSYSGHSSDSASDGDGSGGGIIIYYFVRFLLELTFKYPAIGIPLDFIILVIIFLVIRSKRANPDVFYSSPSRHVINPSRIALNLGQIAPKLSEIFFYDYIYTLFGTLHEARGRHVLSDYAPFFTPEVAVYLKHLSPENLQKVSGVIVASGRIIDLQVVAQVIKIQVDFEANYTEHSAQGASTLYTQERWTFEHLLGFVAQIATEPTSTACPGCGARSERELDGSCPYCGEKTLSNQIGVRVVNVLVKNRQAKGPMLTSNVLETGTDYPTIFQPGLAKRLSDYIEQTPDFSTELFLQRSQGIYIAIQNAWSTLAWERARPYESDCLFQTHRYWIEEYQKQNLRNVLEDISVTSQEIVKVSTDRLFEAITVRIFAQMLDYTIEPANKRLVCGDRSKPRVFSEYWTFMRKRARKQSTRTDFACCPNCGADLKISMAGLCNFCKAKITSGDFDWVASRIEQDEAYAT